MKSEKRRSVPSALERNNELSHYGIVPDNIRNTRSIYAAAMLEELKVFTVAARLLQLFQRGVLPIDSGKSGRQLLKYGKEAATRVSETDRRAVYARVFGFGERYVRSNPTFDQRWMHFLRQASRLRPDDNVHETSLNAASRDLLTYLSSSGEDWRTAMLAGNLEAQLRYVTKFLSAPEIKTAYSGQDMWQVIERLSAHDLGGAKNSFKYRAMATSGATIISWLANNSLKVATTASGQILNPRALLHSTRFEKSSPVAKTNPTDLDLVKACDMWLEVNGTF